MYNVCIMNDYDAYDMYVWMMDDYDYDACDMYVWMMDGYDVKLVLGSMNRVHPVLATDSLSGRGSSHDG